MVGRDIWNSYIESAATQYGVPPALVSSVIGAESSWRPGAEGPATRSGQRAGGMMQLMPDTFAELRRKHGLGPDRFDPQTNIQAGTAYLGQLYKQFGNWPDAIAAYNAGPGRWAQVKAGKADAPRETTDYVQKVTTGFGQGQGADVAGYRTSYRGPGATYEAGPEFNAMLDNIRLNGPPQDRRAPGTYADATGMDPEREAELRAMIERERLNPPGARGSLLDVDEKNNWLSGLGGLLGEGQTASQPPGPSISPLQYQLAGAGSAVGQLAGITNRRVGIGELLGALGGGLTQGAAAGLQAQRQQREDVRAEQESQFNNVYKAAMARKALMPDTEGKIVPKGGSVFYNGKFIPSPGGTVDQSGPLEGTGIDAQMTNVYVTLSQKRARGEQLTPQDEQMLQLSERHLMRPRVVAGPDGVVREVAPAPLPGAGAAPPAVAAPPPAAAPPPGPDLLGINTPPGGAPPPAPAPPATVTPSGSRVTEIVPARAKEIPATAQTAMLGNVAAIRKLSGTLDLLRKNPGATGYAAGTLNMLPGQTVNRLMPGGAEARAGLADIGSMIIHDRSGAAVTVGEMEKLKPFIPTVYDDPASAQMKIQRLQTEIEDMLRDYSQTYSADQNYKENPVVRDVVQTIRPRAPMSGGEGGSGGGAKVMRFDAQGNLIQ